jgi:hypothetical protein
VGELQDSQFSPLEIPAVALLILRAVSPAKRGIERLEAERGLISNGVNRRYNRVPSKDAGPKAETAWPDILSPSTLAVMLIFSEPIGVVALSVH